MFFEKIKQFLNPCRKCKEKEEKGLVACSCTKGLFVKNGQKKGGIICHQKRK